MLKGRLPRRVGRRGLTLLELVVVIAILVALAAILVPLLPQLVDRGNQSSGVTNVGELDKLMQTYYSLNNAFPDGYDSLLNTSQELSQLLPTPEISTSTAPLGGWVVAGSIDAGQYERLKRMSVSRVYDFDDANASHATLYPYSSDSAMTIPPATGRDLAADAEVAVLAKKSGTYAGAIKGVALDDTHTYVVFGIGPACSLCGPDGQVREAPVFLHPKAFRATDEQYQRLAAIFDVGPSGTNGKGAAAKLVAVAGLTGGGLQSASQIIGAAVSKDNQMGQGY
jgi:prepilin-type N-terminal cleavage/methylation domain-containing protein